MSDSSAASAPTAQDLLQGTLDVLILRTLERQAAHGYAVSRWIRERTGGVLEVQDAALYKALRRLERRGHVEAEWGVSENNRRARYYALTDAGRRQLKRESAAWRSYAQAVFTVLEPLPGEV
jgi:PadR family transcriptional regulator, regulatory protein PadR